MARFCPLFSGSSGNSYYIGSKTAGILVDAGRSARQLDKMLEACDINPDAIQGILVTHEHSDHVSGLRVFAKKHSVPIFSSKGTVNKLEGTVDEAKLYEIEDSLQIADMEIEHFHTSHDCAEPIGFRIKTKDDKVITVSTDLGYITEEVEDGLLGADFAVIESNHDVEMLKFGPYPYYLKQRILSNRGHLSNDACADFLPKLANSGTKRFFLAHLSKENNSRQVALETALRSLSSTGLIVGEDFILDAGKPENLEARTVIF